MSESLYRNNPKEGNVFDVLTSRKSILKNPQTGGKSPSVRNPVWVKLWGHDKSCNKKGTQPLTLSVASITDTYYTGGSIKPAPDLESVTVEYGGDWGLARKISATIRCYTIDWFKKIQSHFLFPGNEIDLEFNYFNQTWGASQNVPKLSGYTVASFNFNTTQEGFWICEFTAVSSATAMKTLDMQLTVCNGCLGGGGINYFTGLNEERHKVVGVAQLIAADAQKNGRYSIDDIKDGEVIDPTVDYQPRSQNQAASLVVYKGDHLRSFWDKVQVWVGDLAKQAGIGDSEVESANNQVFVTLGYIVNRIINDQLLRSMSSCIASVDRSRFQELTIEFDPEYSKCRIPTDITSADPTSILLLGNGNYKNSNGEGKDFDKDCKNLGKVKAINRGNGDVKIENILIHRNIIASCYAAATKQRESESDTTDVKDSKEEIIDIMDFFAKISDHISQSVGGAISLRIVEHPKDNKKLIVVDQNFGLLDSTLQCFVFNPIDGDGSTRSCTVQSNVGSTEYKASMFVGASKKGDAVSAIKGCTSDLETVRKQRYNRALDEANEIVFKPGNLGTNHFNGQEIQALKSAVTQMFRNNPKSAEHETIHYPGLSMSIELDGIWGFIPGNAISTTQVPEEYRQMKSYFMVTKVTHQIQQSDWVTKIEGILSYYKNIEYKFI